MKKRHTREQAEPPVTAEHAEQVAAPITLTQIREHCCPQCGALLPLTLSRLEAIRGQEHLRRVVSAAPTGLHSIVVLGSGVCQADAPPFGRISATLA
jgi:hypothetical protein